MYNCKMSGCFLKIALLVHLLIAAAIGIGFFLVLNDHLPPMPEVPEIETKWLGKGARTKEDDSVKPFKIKVDDKVRNNVQVVF